MATRDTRGYRKYQNIGLPADLGVLQEVKYLAELIAKERGVETVENYEAVRVAVDEAIELRERKGTKR